MINCLIFSSIFEKKWRFLTQPLPFNLRLCRKYSVFWNTVCASKKGNYSFTCMQIYSYTDLQFIFLWTKNPDCFMRSVTEYWFVSLCVISHYWVRFEAWEKYSVARDKSWFLRLCLFPIFTPNSSWSLNSAWFSHNVAIRYSKWSSKFHIRSESYSANK